MKCNSGCARQVG